MSASFKFVRGQLLIPPVLIEHKIRRHCRMAIDTGAKFTLITPTLAAEIGIDIDNQKLARELIGIGGDVKAFEITIAHTSMLGMTINNIRAVCYPLSPRLKLDGILGLDFLQHFNMKIENDTETVTIVKMQKSIARLKLKSAGKSLFHPLRTLRLIPKKGTQTGNLWS